MSIAQAAPQFSAAQVLEAGRQAENENQLDYALQFYRHLADHYGAEPEAVAAREALARLGTPVAAPSPSPPHTNGFNGANGHGAPQVAPRADAYGYGNVPAARPASTQVTDPAQGLAQARAAGVGDYMLGRFIAGFFSAIGWVLTATGLGALVLGLLVMFGIIGAETSAAELLGPLLPPAIAAGVLTVGLMIVLWGQIARAIFDGAAASRRVEARQSASNR
ncbi:MAG: hypothetical protein AAFR04_01925 [Pseudomonadota bacterium]